MLRITYLRSVDAIRAEGELEVADARSRDYERDAEATARLVEAREAKERTKRGWRWRVRAAATTLREKS